MKKELSEETSFLEFSKVNKSLMPFKHFYAENVFTEKVSNNLLEWIKDNDLFVQKNEQFYRNSWFNITPENLPAELKDVFSIEGLKILKKKVEDIFEVSFLEDILVFAQKYVKGEGTLIHTDYMEPINRDYQYFFTHRMIAYLNDGWNEEMGGTFGVFRSSNPSDIVNTFVPKHNSAVGIAHGPHSYHAVSGVTNGVRYAIQFNFLSKELKYEGE
ncbi:2OG-Fe(II) oxygenase [Bacillus sp. DJP31]|uniref:2OG-Fe(II) oxygenase n=1 Tax=Bacillus sp. DJP31 TaxID=3409789 RepID=UPI003BB6C00D